jgi:signal transduction histidine kinase/CheY-like chemotaxis protein/HPt (histidine-containing phosphotransfer) domain-containing protein
MTDTGYDPLRRLFFESSSALALLDDCGWVVETNESFRLTFESVSGRDLATLDESLVEFFRNRDAFRFAYHFSRLAAGSARSVTLDTSFRTGNGESRWLRLRAWGIPEDPNAPPGKQGPFVALSIEDLTERHEEEKRLLEAKEHAEKATETKSQFLANMSHEIRTPIQTIIGMTELMQDTQLNREQEEYVRQVKFSADVLLSLVNDILDYSKIEAGQLLLERIEFNPESTVEQAVDMITLEAHKKGLEITLDVAADAPDLIRGDPGRFRQIIVNLVKNAVKFTREGGVVVSIRRSELDGREAVTVSVADTGIGVPVELRQKLFTTFFQGDTSTTRRFGGTGLGLAISRQLVQLMNGTIGMNPNEGGGSVFHFTIPAERSVFGRPKPPRAHDADARILVVDDRPQSRRVLLDYLASFGYSHIEEAASGQEAIRKMETAAAAGKPFTLCFIDMVMPEMDGWRLAAEINQDRAVNAVRLILMVPQGSLGADAKMTMLKWFNAYINKPIKRRELYDAVFAVDEAIIDLEGAASTEILQEEAFPDKPIDAAAETTDLSAAREDLSFGPEHRNEHLEPSVLVVEDHPVNQRLLRLVLEKLGYGAVIANDGVEAIEMAQRDSFKLIFMDIQMPRMNGYEATERLRALGYDKPIIAVTASALTDERERCSAAGMDDILVKPYKRQDVDEMLQKWMLCEKRPGEVEELAELEDVEDLEEVEELETAEEDAPDEPPRVPAIAVDELLANFFGKKDVVDSLLERFIARTKEQVAGMSAAAERGDWETLQREAHTIKGSALNLAAKELGEAAAKTEQAAKGQDAPTASVALAALGPAFERFERAARAIIGSQP